MKVKELIDMLREQDPDDDVFVIDDKYNGDTAAVMGVSFFAANETDSGKAEVVIEAEL